MTNVPPWNAPQSAAVPGGPNVAMVLSGVLFMVIWGGACAVLIVFSLTAMFMANDAGAASSDQHGNLMLGLLASEVVVAAAGVPVGLAFFWSNRRGVLLLIAAVIFVIGLLGGVGSVVSFSPKGQSKLQHRFADPAEVAA